MSDTLAALQTLVSSAAPFVRARLSLDQQQVLVYILGGLTADEAIHLADSEETSDSLQANETFCKYLTHIRAEQQRVTSFTREDAHLMLMETHRKSINATEELGTIKELISLHGVAVPKTQVNINQNLNATVSKSDMRRLPDGKLFEMLGTDVDDLEPQLIDYDEEV